MSLKISTQVPIWSRIELLEDILRNSENDESIRVNNVTSKIATENGDNYMSDIIRASVEYTRVSSGRKITEKKSLIFKIPLSNGDGLDMSLESFETEIRMMENTLVKMSDILNEKYHRLSARVLYTNFGDHPFIVMEDLADRGFRMADRQAGLDLEHCMLVMRRLAKFHASSVAVYEKDPSCIDLYRKGIYHSDAPEKLKKLCRDAVKIVGDEVANWTELNPRYSEKLLKLSEVCYEKAIECARPRDDDFNVINHGDCWANNMLFRYDDEGKVIDHIFVDFQISFWSSPAIDILNFLSANPNDDVLLHHRDELLDEYRSTLEETMSRLDCKKKPPSNESLRRCLRERELLSVLYSSLGLPFMLIDKTEVISLSEMMKIKSGYVNPEYKGQRFRNIMVRRLKEWNARGLLDF